MGSNVLFSAAREFAEQVSGLHRTTSENQIDNARHDLDEPVVVLPEPAKQLDFISIPLEALRVGADTFASDLNPVPVLLNEMILEYVPKYGSTMTGQSWRRPSRPARNRKPTLLARQIGGGGNAQHRDEMYVRRMDLSNIEERIVRDVDPDRPGAP